MFPKFEYTPSDRHLEFEQSDNEFTISDFNNPCIYIHFHELYDCESATPKTSMQYHFSDKNRLIFGSGMN